MSNRVIIYGPPASGKSTVLRSLASTKDCTVIDLEQVAGSAGFARQNRITLLQKLAALRFGGDLFIGAADIDPSDFPPGFRVVALLHTDKAQYLARVDQRNRIPPGKAWQDEDRLFDLFTQVVGKNPHWIHIDPARFEDRHELLVQHLFERLNG